MTTRTFLIALGALVGTLLLVTMFFDKIDELAEHAAPTQKTQEEVSGP